jgi:hypothetical protein
MLATTDLDFSGFCCQSSLALLVLLLSAEWVRSTIPTNRGRIRIDCSPAKRSSTYISDYGTNRDLTGFCGIIPKTIHVKRLQHVTSGFLKPRATSREQGQSALSARRWSP